MRLSSLPTNVLAHPLDVSAPYEGENMRYLTLQVVSIFPIFYASVASASPDGDWGSGYGHMMWNGGHGLLGILMMVVFWGLVIGLIVLGVRRFSGRSGASSQSSALDILKERYARGEIEEDEFERRKAKLEH